MEAKFFAGPDIDAPIRPKTRPKTKPVPTKNPRPVTQPPPRPIDEPGKRPGNPIPPTECPITNIKLEDYSLPST